MAGIQASELWSPSPVSSSSAWRINARSSLSLIVRFDPYLMNQWVAINFFQKKINTESTLIGLKDGNGILGITLCTLVPDNKLTCAVAGEEILEDSSRATLLL
ncbi:MAG: hypothetical protein MZV70_53310 [Desulfobacterales bacterium]|nr:hypothetical protein [Desulfobacterales bacterium]